MPQRTAACTAAALVLAITPVWSQQELGAEQVSLPRLQRACIQGNVVWLFDFEGRRRPRNPALVTMTLGKAEPQQVTRYHLFGAAEHVWGEALPFRWDMTRNFVFNTQALWGPPPAAPVIQRYRQASLVARPDDGSGAGALDLEHWEDPGYVGGTPMSSALQGFHGGWKETNSRVGDPARVIHYDLRAVDDSTIEWFMTVDGELWRWTYDGCGGERKCDWKDPRLYAVRITKPFLILSDGKSLITERDGDWCLVHDLDLKADCVSLFTKLLGETLTVVEDQMQGTYYFLHGNRLRDAQGREVFSVKASPSHTEMVVQAAEFVITRRQQP